MGTSLKVQPFAGLIHDVPKTTARLLLNFQKAGCYTEQNTDLPALFVRCM